MLKSDVFFRILNSGENHLKYIKEFIQKVALANPDRAIKLITDGKTVFQTNGNGKIEDVIYLIYGKQIKENIVKVNYEEENIKITGVIGNTTIARDTRKDQIIFLNKRNIKNQILTNSGDQAFKGSTGIGKYGFYVLNLEMPANYYDVNVHPTKMEVRFKDESLIYKTLYHAIKSAILSKEFLGNTQTENHNEKYIENELEFLTQRDKLFEQNSNNEELVYREDKRKIDYKYIGILFRTYIIIQVENEIFLIDQHAAHERLLYEQIKENYKSKVNSNSQMMLIPEVINLTHKEIEFIQKNIELIKEYGFDIEMFGDNAVKINGIPDIEYRAKSNKKNIFLDILDEMITNERSSIKDIEERFIATVACKAAVKANMDLTPQEVDNLIQELLTLKNPYTCPHGRPTTIKISKEQLLKM